MSYGKPMGAALELTRAGCEELKEQEERGKPEHEPEAEQEGECGMFGELDCVEGRLLETEQAGASPSTPKGEMIRVWQSRAGQALVSRAEDGEAPGEGRQELAQEDRRDLAGPDHASSEGSAGVPEEGEQGCAEAPE